MLHHHILHTHNSNQSTSNQSQMGVTCIGFHLCHNVTTFAVLLCLHVEVWNTHWYSLSLFLSLSICLKRWDTTQTCLTPAPFYISDFAPGVVEVEIQSQFNCARWWWLGHTQWMHLNNSKRKASSETEVTKFPQYFLYYLILKMFIRIIYWI